MVQHATTLGAVYKDIGCYDLAIQDYNRAIKLASGIAAIHDNRGVAYSAKGEHDLAIRDHNRAIELHSQFALAYNNRGCAWVCKLLAEEPGLTDRKTTTALGTS